MNIGKIIAGIIVAIAVTAFFSIFIVKEVNQAIVLQFGDPKRIIVEPGINFKLRCPTRRGYCIRSKKINCRCIRKISNY